MELKFNTNDNRSLKVGKCLNRTFMELKYTNVFAICEASNSLNRTFMELKFWRPYKER